MGKTISTGMVSATINGITINSTIPCSSGNYNNCANRTVSYIVMHYTGNTKDVAKSNATYFATSGRNASAHFFVDDSNIYQSVELRDTAWHCGASSYKHASCRNANSIGIEMCCTAGNYKISETTKTNAAYLCAYICDLLGITAGQVDTYVLRHYDVTSKNCPAQMVTNESEWTAFKSAVKSILSASASTTSAEGNTSYCGTGIGKAVALTTIHIRSGAGVGYSSYGTISSGTAVEVLEILDNSWYKIVWPGATCGYAYTSNSTGKYYTYTPNSTTSTTSSTTSSTASSASISSTTTSSSSSSVSVEPAESKDTSLSKSYTTTAKLNLRAGAGTDKAIITTIPKGGSVRCYGYYTSVGNVKWLSVVYGEYKGFCSSSYLK